MVLQILWSTSVEIKWRGIDELEFEAVAITSYLEILRHLQEGWMGDDANFDVILKCEIKDVTSYVNMIISSLTRFEIDWVIHAPPKQ